MELHHEVEGERLINEAGHVARMVAWEVQLLEVLEGTHELPEVVRPPKEQGVYVAVVEIRLLLLVKHMQLVLIYGGIRILCHVDIDRIQS